MNALTQPTLRCTPFNGEAAEWDAVVTATPGSTFCHLAGWRDITDSVLGHETTFLVALDEAGTWHGLLPLVRVRSRLFGHFLISMPFINYGGPLGTDAAVTLLLDEAQGLARRSGVDLLELRSRHPVATALHVAHRKIVVTRELPESADALWHDGLPSKVRSQVRRPQKEGMEARFGSDQLEPFYDVFARNMRDLGTPVLPKAFFDRISRVHPAYVTFGVVYWKDQPVAGGCGFSWQKEFEMTWASSLREHNRMAPNMLLYWSFMEHVIQAGIRVFNFGRCTPGGGTHRFKRQWGGQDCPLPWIQWSSRDVASTPSPERGVFRLATKAWGRMPLAVANRLGPVLARKLP